MIDPDGRVGYDPSTHNNRLVDSYCYKCGSPILFRCPACNQPLAGFRGQTGVPKADDFCRHCGGEFPWTSRAAMASRLRDLLANEPLEANDRLEAQEALDTLTMSNDAISDEAKTRAVGKLRHLASEGWWRIANPIVVSFISAEVQRRSGLPPA
jgi:hypothetical protein